ncbi:hypothetical protein Tco_0575565 [Tanacetum coccineum]
MKRWEELIRENVFGLGGHRDHLPASLAHMLYCIVAEEQYNLAYFFVKRIECARATPNANLPYGMFLTRLFRHIMEHYPHLDNGIYNVVDRVMRPLTLKQTQKPQNDDEDDDASRASTPSPTTYLNSLRPLNYQRYDIPTSSQQDDNLLFERQTDLLNQTLGVGTACERRGARGVVVEVGWGQDMKRWEELIHENVFGLGGHQDHLSASLAYMLYCIVAEEQYNFIYFFVKRIKCAWATPTANIPYGMFLTHLYRHVMEHYPHLDNGIYNVVDRVMRPLALKQTRKPRSDHGKARHSVSSTSAHHNYGSSSHQAMHDDGDVSSRASTKPSTYQTYLNFLRPLNYQRYDIPTSSQQDDDLLFERQNVLLNQSQQIHKEVRVGFKSFRKALRGVFEKKKK